MRNIPVFTTEYGVASLILKEIPYRAAAYIKLQDSQDPEAFLKECCDFCRAVGAEYIYAAGHLFLERYPVYTSVWRMEVDRSQLPETDAQTVPVTEETLEQWKTLYNQKMASVPNSAYFSAEDVKEMYSRKDGYFIRRQDALLGIGKAAGEKVDAVISLRPGAGKDVVLALNRVLTGGKMILEVASENIRAVRLYTRLGFKMTDTVATWYHIL